MSGKRDQVRGRVLVVEDDGAARAVVSEGLRQGGFEVVTAETGEDALEICTRVQIDLAVLDHGLPSKSGLEVADELRRDFEIPFLFLTANDDRALAREAVARGAHGFLHKPIRISDLLTQVEAAFSRAAEVRNLDRAVHETRKINVAIGLLMAVEGLTRKAAVERLRSICRPRQVKAHEAASEIIAAFEARVGADARLGDALGAVPSDLTEPSAGTARPRSSVARTAPSFDDIATRSRSPG